jgi:pyruvate dehydrogenase E1 component beta subunit
MKYKHAITNLMTELSKDEKVIFLGQGIINAGRMGGTLKNVPIDNCIEMPVAENLIVGAAMGLCLKGYRPVITFAFMDFMLVCADAIINHMALMPKLSNGQFSFPIIMRACVGAQGNRFEMGAQHNKNLGYIFSPYINTVNFDASITADMLKKINEPLLIIEKRDLYEQDIVA